MRILKAFACAVVGACVSGTCLIAADVPFVGRWKLNVPKSDFGGLTITIAEPSPGEFRISQAAFAGWFRTTWMPWINAIPSSQREAFSSQVIERYLHRHPPDVVGRVHVKMVRLEVLARKGN